MAARETGSVECYLLDLLATRYQGSMGSMRMGRLVVGDMMAV